VHPEETGGGGHVALRSLEGAIDELRLDVVLFKLAVDRATAVAGARSGRRRA
jgi:hypothetical protein